MPDLSRQLAKGDILTLGDFADLSVEELRELGVVMPAEDAGEKIIQARKIAYDLEDDKKRMTTVAQIAEKYNKGVEEVKVALETLGYGKGFKSFAQVNDEAEEGWMSIGSKRVRH